MKKTQLISLFLILFGFQAVAQGYLVFGTLTTDESEPVEFANLALYNSIDSSLYKVETTDDQGAFKFAGITTGQYFLVASYIGLEDLSVPSVIVNDGDLDLGILVQASSSIELETAVVKAKRAMVEVKPDRTVFNVEGTINSAGENGLNLLRKAPGVLLDNNNNVSVLGRSGVIFYVDGKRLPISGDDLVAYLQNLQAEQIDRIDIISNPGAKYEAEGNAGIIDIRLKKDKSLGANGSVSATYSSGVKDRYSVNSTGNYRNKHQNIFGSLGYGRNIFHQDMAFDQYFLGSGVNGSDIRVLNEDIFIQDGKGINYRLGTDFFVAKNHTVGFLVSGGNNDNEGTAESISYISSVIPKEFDTTPWDVEIPTNDLDSVLFSNQFSDGSSTNQSYNLNYAFNNGSQTINIDADYGRFRNKSDQFQPNEYTTADTTLSLRSRDVALNTPVDIDIYTFKVDYENDVLGGKLGFGSKYSIVSTDNVFLFFDIPDGERIRNDDKSNEFFYDENVLAGYVNYARSLSEKWNLSAGTRVEQTMTNGELLAYKEELQTDPVDSSYLNIFPNVGLTYQASRRSTLALNYGRRINRPDYNVLNPFKVQYSELGFAIGNPRLQPEIVNNVELGWTFDYRYNFKLAYSKTTNQITRLLGQDESDVRASFINWDNLAEQDVMNLSISAPFQPTEKWGSYWNISATYLQNSSDDGAGNVIDLSVFNYTIFQQQTITLPKGFVGEISGWFSGPGIWGGVFEYESSFALNLGLQKKFLQDKMNVKLSVNDIFNQAFWSGVSDYDGLLNYGAGNFDNRRVSLSVSYNFGNSNVKTRKRSTGIEDESKRVGDGN